MNRAQKELDRMSAEAWGELSSDVRRTCKRVGEVGSACAREHPLLVVGGGALLGALAVSRVRKPAPADPKPAREEREEAEREQHPSAGQISSTLMMLGRMWLARTLSSATEQLCQAGEAHEADDESELEELVDEAACADEHAATVDEKASVDDEQARADTHEPALADSAAGAR